MPYSEFVEWLAYFKIKGEEAKRDILDRERDRAMAKQRTKPIRKG